jgi:hypothetical protein
MTVLDLFVPSKTRTFTYYDRASILLDAEEMVSTRIRILVSILGSPLSRDKNLKFSPSKEWFGTWTAMFNSDVVNAGFCSYPNQIVYDYWNQHGTLAHQLTDFIEKIDLVSQLVQFVLGDLKEEGTYEDATQAALSTIQRLSDCFVIDAPPVPRFVNTFVQPANLFKFVFPQGTVFQIVIQSWVMSFDGLDILPGNPNTEEPFDPADPFDTSPFPTGDDPANPYGEDPPPQTERNPFLDERDYSNAPLPELPTEVQIRIFGIALLGPDYTPRAVDYIALTVVTPVTVAWEIESTTGNGSPDGITWRLRVTGPAYVGVDLFAATVHARPLPSFELIPVP